MLVRCPTCGASWPVDRPSGSAAPLCPVCAEVDPNAGGSPSGVEAEDEQLLSDAT